MFPIRPVPENDVKKPDMFVFTDIEDYRQRGKGVDARYNAGRGRKSKKVERIRHKKFGLGTVVERKDPFIVVSFDGVGVKQLNEQVCVEKGLIEFV